MKGPSIRPKVYQDVKVTLKWYTSFLIIAFSIIFYFVYKLGFSIEKITITATLTFLIGGISWILIFFFEIHDKVYDRHFIKWRIHYDKDFIIPALIKPFLRKVDFNFLELYENNHDKRFDIMEKLFYHFVGDSAGEARISENKIVRFYESITKYWITQINEIMIFFFIIINFILYLISNYLNISLNSLILINFILILFFLINRYLVKFTKDLVRFATKDEIKSIHDEKKEELEIKLKEIHEENGFAYGG